MTFSSGKLRSNIRAISIIWPSIFNVLTPQSLLRAELSSGSRLRQEVGSSRRRQFSLEEGPQVRKNRLSESSPMFVDKEGQLFACFHQENERPMSLEAPPPCRWSNSPDSQKDCANTPFTGLAQTFPDTDRRGFPRISFLELQVRQAHDRSHLDQGNLAFRWKTEEINDLFVQVFYIKYTKTNRSIATEGIECFLTVCSSPSPRSESTQTLRLRPFEEEFERKCPENILLFSLASLHKSSAERESLHLSKAASIRIMELFNESPCRWIRQ